MQPRLELFVADPDRSVRFYSDVLGFSVVGGGGRHRMLRRGGARLAIGGVADLDADHHFRPEIATQRRGLGVEIVFEVDDVEALYERVCKTHYPISDPLAPRPWGLTDFRIADPDGYYLRLTS